MKGFVLSVPSIAFDLKSFARPKICSNIEGRTIIGHAIIPHFFRSVFAGLDISVKHRHLNAVFLVKL